MSTIGATFAAIVAAPLPTQDRVDLAQYLLATGFNHTTDLLLARAISDAMTAGLARQDAWYRTHDRTVLARD